MNQILLIVAQCFYLMLPAYFANMAPVIMKDLHLFEWLAKPLDMDRKINHKPILGSHKTFRGLIFGVVFAVVISFIQSDLRVYPLFSELSVINYSSWLAIGVLMGLGAIIGDSIKSFFKRRVNINPGKRFIPWDQVDYSIGALIFLLPVAVLSWEYYLISILLSFVLHIAANHIAYLLGLREVRW